MYAIARGMSGKLWKTINCPNLQIPKCNCSIYHNDPFRTEMCRCVHFCFNGVLWGIEQVHSGICETGGHKCPLMTSWQRATSALQPVYDAKPPISDGYFPQNSKYAEPVIWDHMAFTRCHCNGLQNRSLLISIYFSSQTYVQIHKKAKGNRFINRN